jgi:hypothetical protein
MKAKNFVYALLIIITVAIIGVTIKNRKEKLSEKGIYDWFNGWTADLVKFRTIYHEKLSKIAIPDTTDEGALNEKKLRELLSYLTQTKELELWKIDSGLIVTDFWFKKIDPMLSGKLNEDLTAKLKNYMLEGQKIGMDFRQQSQTYFDDYLTVISFIHNIISVGKKMDNNERNVYSNLQSKYLQSQEKYTKRVNEIYAYNVKRVEEFNIQFKNPNISKLLNLINSN